MVGKRRLHAGGAATVLSLALILSACGSSGGDSASTTAAAGTAASGGSANAAAELKKLMTVDPSIRITEPLKQKPSPGTLVYLKCDAPSCIEYEKGFKAATAAAGWQLQVLNFTNADTSTFTSAMDQALRLNPDAVVLPGVDPPLWASMVPKYEQAKVPIITEYITDLPKLTSPLVPIASEPQQQAQGEALAYVAAANTPAGGKILYVNIPTYPIFRHMGNAFVATVKKDCPDCEVQELDITIPQLANQKVVPAVIAELRRDPKIGFVATVSGDILNGLTAQLGVNGMQGKVKIAANMGQTQSMSEVLNGQMVAVTNQSTLQCAWMAVDAALRLQQGMDLPYEAYAKGPQVVVLDKSNLGTPAMSWEAPKDYDAQFKKLWLVG